MATRKEKVAGLLRLHVLRDKQHQISRGDNYNKFYLLLLFDNLVLFACLRVILASWQQWTMEVHCWQIGKFGTNKRWETWVKNAAELQIFFLILLALIWLLILILCCLLAFYSLLLLTLQVWFFLSLKWNKSMWSKNLSLVFPLIWVDVLVRMRGCR